MSQRPTSSNRFSDDWDTDPDFVRDMDEMDQRWGGNKRTVGSINMSELIDDIRREHHNLRDKYKSELGNLPPNAKTINERESSKLSTKEIKREIIKNETSSYIKESNGSVMSETYHETGKPPMRSYTSSSTTSKSPIPPITPKPDFSDLASRLSRTRLSETEPLKRYDGNDTIITTDPPRQFKESSVSKSIFREEKSSSSSSARDSETLASGNLPQAFSKSIQEKIDAFKREFDDIEHKVARKSDISKVIKKTTDVDKRSEDVQYVSRSNDRINSSDSGRGALFRSPDSTRPTSASPLSDTKPKANIKSLSEKFETLGRESSDDFKRRMEERRKEFFDRIKTQVRETRKGLDGFDINESDDDEHQSGNRSRPQTGSGGMKQFVTKLNSPSSPSYGSQSSKLSNDSLGSVKPKVYTRRETTQEEVVSRIVKEDDKIVHDETKRNVERTSSCHGSSDEENATIDGEPTSIKNLDRELRSSPQQRTQSPIDEIKRKVPVIETPVKGAGLMARTLYDYQAAEEDELCFDVDDLITNIEKVDKGWYRGTITKDDVKRVGLFPANYVKLLNDTSEY